MNDLRTRELDMVEVPELPDEDGFEVIDSESVLPGCRCLVRDLSPALSA
jgi:hypothetical protein